MPRVFPPRRIFDCQPGLLDQSFFSRPVLTVARELLGKDLIYRGKRYCITEVEAYDGPDDKACHGRFGLTKRTAVMFGPAGRFYVYFVYGSYWMLNIVTGDVGYPSAVLIRGVEGYSGPGKLTRDLGIDGSFNGKLVSPESGLWIEESGTPVDPTHIQALPRVGVDYAGEWARKPYRFVLRM